MGQAIFEKLWEQHGGRKKMEKKKINFFRWKRKTLITWLNPNWERNIS